MADEDTPWYRQLLISLAVLVGVAVLIVGVLAVGAFTAARLLGVTGSAPSSSPQSVSIPSQSTPSPATGPKSASSRPTATRRPHHSPRPHPAAQAITLTVSPSQVPAYGRIDLNGSYSAPDGTTLQVQRQESSGTWLDFPATTSVTGGSFTTYIKTGHTGTNRLRVTDLGTGAVSNVATVQVG